MPDTEDKDKDLARRWRERSRRAFASSWVLFHDEDFRGCANRAYYASYQACSAVSVAHGDSEKFPTDWNNPSHEQLPQLIQNNGDVSVSTRRQVRTNLAYLRNTREDADYRVGRTVDKEMARRCLRFAGNILGLLGTDEE